MADHATAAPYDAGDAPTGASFATYLTATERAALDARAATAEQERDDALDDRDRARAERDDYARSRNRFADLLQTTATALHMPDGAPITDIPATAAKLRAELARLDPARVAAWITERDELAGGLAAAEQDLARVTAERDEERANFADAAKQIAELLHANARVIAERTEARAEVERVTADRDRLVTAACVLVDAAERTRMRWADATGEVRTKDLWQPLHRAADDLRELLNDAPAVASVPPTRAQEPAGQSCPVHVVALPGCPHPRPADTYAATVDALTEAQP